MLELEGVSRNHARITYEDGLYRIEDLGSTNGVRVNGKKIQGSRSLINGDRIGISDAILLFTDEHSILAEEDLSRLKERSAHGGAKGTPAWLPGALIAVVIIALIGGAAAWLLKPPPGKTTLIDNDTTGPAANTEPTPEPPRSVPSPQPTRPVSRPEPKPAAEPLHYYYVQSNPPGAHIQFDGEAKGDTPAMLTRLKRGTHRLVLSKPGYNDLSLQFLFVPADGDAPVYNLIQAKATCHLTSEPDGATVYWGARILGRTPFVVTNLPPGPTELRFEAPGYAPITAKAQIDPLRATELHVKMIPNLGSVELITYPANAKVFVDDVQVAISEPASAQEFYSAPLLLTGLAAGGHTIYMDCYGLKTQPQTITVEAGGKLQLVIAHYLPNVTVETTDGRIVNGMLRRQSPAGDLELALPHRQKVSVKAQLIKKVTIVPFDEYVSKKLRGEVKQ